MRIARPYLLVLLLAITWLAHLYPTRMLAQSDWDRVLTFSTDMSWFSCLSVTSGSDGDLYLLARFGGTAAIGDTEFTSKEYPSLVIIHLSQGGQALGAVSIGAERSVDGHTIEWHDGQVYVSGLAWGDLLIGDSVVATSQEPQFGFIATFAEDLQFQRMIVAHGNVSFHAMSCHGTNILAAGSVTAERYSLGAIEFTSAGNQMMLWAAFDMEGALVWSDTAGSANSTNTEQSFRSVQAVKADKNGHVYSICTVVSSSAFTNGFSVEVAQRTTVVTRHSPLGDLEWVLQVGGDSSYCFPSDLAVTDAALFVCGGILGELTVHDSVYLRNTKLFGYDGFVLKMTLSGVPQWATHVGSLGLVDLRAIQVMNDGTSVMAGQFGGETITINDQSRSTATPRGGFLARLRPDGSTESIAIAGLSASESSVIDACTDRDGTSHVCGSFNGTVYLNDSITTGGSEMRGYLISTSIPDPTSVVESNDLQLAISPITVIIHDGTVQIRDHLAESPISGLQVHSINGQLLPADYTITSDHTAVIYCAGMTSQGLILVTLHRANGTVDHARAIWTP